MNQTSEQLAPSKTLLDVILASLEDDKAQDIVTVPLMGKSSIADYMVIASGASARQLMAMADHLGENLKKMKLPTANSEGRQGGDWILLDAGDVIVHLFRPEVRDFYQLEKMWQNQQDEETIPVHSV